MIMILGTSHFESLTYALLYYRDYVSNMSNSELREYVSQKIERGEIHVGRPTVKPGEKILLNSIEGRYFIETNLAAST